jgi:hypothetical protein
MLLLEKMSKIMAYDPRKVRSASWPAVSRRAVA